MITWIFNYGANSYENYLFILTFLMDLKPHQVQEFFKIIMSNLYYKELRNALYFFDGSLLNINSFGWNKWYGFV